MLGVGRWTPVKYVIENETDKTRGENTTSCYEILNIKGKYER